MPSQPHRPRRQSPRNLGGAHELGQNFLIDRRFTTVMADILRHAPPLPVLELGAGSGAVTDELIRAGLAVTAVELDPGQVRCLRERFSGRADIVAADMLHFDYGDTGHHVVSNVPFGITTPLLRRLLAQQRWHTAVLMLQWEVARKRAGVGGTTMLTASWWPWYEFVLDRRVPASAFRPPPAVDAGILIIRRRARPLIAVEERHAYQRLVRAVFTGPGRGLSQILSGQLPRRVIALWLRDTRVGADSLPRGLTVENWVSLYAVAHGRGRPRDPEKPRG
ncbi:MAG: 23S ribosomal RNA methyltransferase Erm [Actinomycetota bacterium]|nr:23S ribosomal RNA methyltransferase Erm [Actinomycetota bacterium]